MKASRRKSPSTSPKPTRLENPSAAVSLAGSTRNSSTPSASPTPTVSSWAAAMPVEGLAALPDSARVSSSALKLSAVIPSESVSNSETAPRTTGRPSGLTRRVIETNGFSSVAIVPSGRRTATATREGERIMTPSITAWPPTGRKGMDVLGTGTAPGRARCAAAGAVRRQLGLGGRRLRRSLVLLAAVAPAEALHAPGLVHQLLLAGIERVAGGADFEVVRTVRGGRALDRGARLDDVSAHALEADGLVDGMDPGLHESSPWGASHGRRHAGPAVRHRWPARGAESSSFSGRGVCPSRGRIAKWRSAGSLDAAPSRAIQALEPAPAGGSRWREPRRLQVGPDRPLELLVAPPADQQAAHVALAV